MEGMIYLTTERSVHTQLQHASVVRRRGDQAEGAIQGACQGRDGLPRPQRQLHIPGLHKAADVRRSEDQAERVLQGECQGVDGRPQEQEVCTPRMQQAAIVRHVPGTKQKEFCAGHAAAGMVNVKNYAGGGVRGGDGRRGGTAGSWMSTVVPPVPPTVSQTEASTQPTVAVRRGGDSHSSSSSSSSRIRISPVGAEEAVVTEGIPPCPSVPADGDEGDALAAAAAATVVKTEEVALSSGVIAAAACPVREGGAAAHRTAAGRNKRKGHSSPTFDEANTAVASSSGYRSSKTTGWRPAKRTRRTGNDDVVVLESDDQPGEVSGSATRRQAAGLEPGAKVAVKPEL